MGGGEGSGWEGCVKLMHTQKLHRRRRFLLHVVVCCESNSPKTREGDLGMKLFYSKGH